MFHVCLLFCEWRNHLGLPASSLLISSDDVSFFLSFLVTSDIHTSAHFIIFPKTCYLLLRRSFHCGIHSNFGIFLFLYYQISPFYLNSPSSAYFILLLLLLFYEHLPYIWLFLLYFADNLSGHSSFVCLKMFLNSVMPYIM